MSDSWTEAANRRLRAFLWAGSSIGQVAARLGRTREDVAGQMRRLGIVLPGRRVHLRPAFDKD